MRRTVLISILLILASCGDPLVEGDYRGQPLIEIGGTILVQDDLSAEDSKAVRVALLWVGADQQDSLSQGRSESSFPARYTMQVYSRPPDRAMRPVDDRDGLYGVARIVLFVDSDGDESIAPTERIVGASESQVLTYFTSSEPTSLVDGPFRTGYQMMKLHSCEDRLAGQKAMLGPVPREDAVDLRLEDGIAKALADLDCDSVADDFCFDLRLQVQEHPDDDDLLSLYRDRCEVGYEPEFNNTSDEKTSTDGDDKTGGDETSTNNATNDGEVPLCEREPEHAECQDAPSADEVIRECKPLLGDAIGVGEIDQREAYWRFSECTADYDPCKAVEWAGGEDRWQDYQMCIFDKFTAHHEAWCRDVAERKEQVDGADREYLQSEFERADCSLVI